MFHIRENADQRKPVFWHISRRGRCEICSKLTYPSGLIFGAEHIYGRAYIRDVNWVIYLGVVYTGGILTGFYGIAAR